MVSPLSHFKLTQFQFIIRASDCINLPEYKGSTLRGGFGHAFKKVVCALRTKECPDCLLKEKCIYSYVFETPPPSDSRMMRKYPSAPHPFILCPPLETDRIYEPGEGLQFRLTLIGKAMDYLPYFIYTFEELGTMGLGKGRGKFTLEEVKAIPAGEKSKSKEGEGQTIYSGAEKILRNKDAVVKFEDFDPSSFEFSALPLSFLTPTRLKFQEELISDLKFHIFFRNLLRRISLLSYFHCGKGLDVDFRSLIKESEKIETSDSHLHWHDWERYSARQGNKMKLGGFMGKITFSGELQDFWPFLELGEFIHVGKGSSFGLGKYEMILNRS